MSNDLTRHSREILSAVSSNKYERTGDERGIYLPKAKAFLSGRYVHSVNGQDERIDPNLLPDEGLIYLLTVGVYNGAKIGTWYLSLYSANYTPLMNLTAASYPATASEITSPIEGYAEPTRPVWTPSAPAAGNTIDNMANKALYTIVTSSSVTVNGAALLSEATKGAITGKLVSATKFSQTRVLYNTDAFTVGYEMQLTSS